MRMFNKNTIKIFAALLFLSLFITSTPSMAETIAVVDIKLIVDESSAAKDINKQIENKREKYQTEVTKEEDDLRKEDQKLSEQRSVLEKDAFEEKAKVFRKKVVDAQRNVQLRRNQLESAYMKALEKVKDTTIEIISEIAKEKGFDIAVPKSQVLYSKDSLDISKEVMAKLNDRLPSVKVVIEEKK